VCLHNRRQPLSNIYRMRCMDYNAADAPYEWKFTSLGRSVRAPPAVLDLALTA
jgi:hypothetical protein